ncbi:MAG TPA: CoB--CoM heterodisulfide reductase iron-sulfur subunit B family protein [Anaerolineae bacterium]|nr:CoB--CoM heterodisulfide reductase iron-sulfur subunit B family protein [Anaerolineae bacterium]
MKVSYFPGCTLNTTGKGYDNAVRASAAAVGLDLVELPEWNCCGATYPLIVDNMLELAAPTHILVSAHEQALDEGHEAPLLTTACTTCYNVLRRTNHFIRNHPEERERVNAFIEKEYAGEVEVKDILHVLRDDIGFELIHEKVQSPLKDLKVAAYYGCMVLRPPAEVAYDDPDNPRSLDDLMAALGAVPVDHPHKNECCGAYLAVKAPDVTREMAFTILKSARSSGAEAVVTNCPLCQFNLDRRQREMTQFHAGFAPIPVYYFSQLMGLALGLDAGAYGWERHYVDARPQLRALGLWNG